MATMRGYVPTDKWERYLYEEMRKQLPHDWVVLANVAWSLRKARRDAPGLGYVRDGQADFVVLAPRLGLLVVEVKGSKGYRVAEDGRWYRKVVRRDGVVAEELLDESPCDQARRNLHQVVEECCAHLACREFPGLYGHVVAYPQGRIVEGSLPLDDATTVLVAAGMQDLARRFRDALKARGAEDRGALFTEAVRDELSSRLTTSRLVIAKADTGMEISADVEKVQSLTRSQFSALQGIFWNTRVAVTGPAGSGKTLLAVWRAKAFKGEGRRVLLTCYSKKLAGHLRREHPDLAPDIKSVDKLFMDLAADAGVQIPRLEGDELNRFFRQVLPETIVDLGMELPPAKRFDAIIVDEGQDFSPEQQVALLELLKDDGESAYAFFWDAGQDLFRQAIKLPLGTTAMFMLEHNCRNTIRICEKASVVGDRLVKPMPGLPEGLAPVVEVHGSQQGMANRAWAILDEWRRGTSGRLAVLSPYQLPNSCLAQVRRSHGMRLVEDLEEWDSAGCVLFSTIRSFKGIEADAVLVVDVGEAESSPVLSREDLYVACTRPTGRLALLARSDRAALSWTRQ